MNAYEILQTYDNYAVVGMHPDPESYANKIYHLLKEKEKTVYGLNPKHEFIDQEPIYKDLDHLDQEVDVAVFLVNPKIGIQMLDSMKKHQIKYLWMQPGSVDEAFKDQAQKKGLKVIEACVLAVYAIHDR